MFRISLLTKLSPIANKSPPTRHIIRFKKPASSGVIIGIVIKRSIPQPSTSKIDSQSLCLDKQARVRAIETKIKSTKHLESKQHISVPALKPSIVNGSPAIAPPMIPPTKNKRSIPTLAIKQVMVFDATYSILFERTVNKFLTYPLLKSSATNMQTNMAATKKTRFMLHIEVKSILIAEPEVEPTICQTFLKPSMVCSTPVVGLTVVVPPIKLVITSIKTGISKHIPNMM